MVCVARGSGLLIGLQLAYGHRAPNSIATAGFVAQDPGAFWAGGCCFQVVQGGDCSADVVKYAAEADCLFALMIPDPGNIPEH